MIKVALRFWGFTPDSAEDDDGPGEEGLCTDGMIRRLGEWRSMMKGFGSKSIPFEKLSDMAANLLVVSRRPISGYRTRNRVTRRIRKQLLDDTMMPDK